MIKSYADYKAYLEADRIALGRTRSLRSIFFEDFWASNKPVSAVCHAPIALVNAKDSSGEYIVKGREVTGFTNSEEEAVGLTKIVPFLVEDRMIARGAEYSKVDDWQSYTRQDGNLITGQNPASSEAVANLVLAAVERQRQE